MKIKIISIGKFPSRSPLKELFEYYQSRIVEKVSLTQIKSVNFEKKKKLINEKEMIEKNFDSNSEIIILDRQGLSLTSENFATLIRKKMLESQKNLTFVIGGDNGLHESFRNKYFNISFGQLTWPHLLFRVMIIEQIYRANKINSNHSYHK